MNKYLRQMLIARGYFSPETGGEGGSGGGGGVDDGGNDSVEDEDDKAGATDDKKGDESTKVRKFSDDEAAKLLKENVKRKTEQKKLTDELAAAQARLAQFDGIDVEEVRKLVSDKQAAEEEKLKKSGEWDRLKAQMLEVHTREKQALSDNLTALTEQLSGLRATVGDLTVGNAFGNSKYLADDVTLTPRKARALWGAHFDFEDGKIVAYDKPAGAKERTMLVDGAGEPLDFEIALAKIVQSDPDYDTIAKSKLKVGANSTTKGSDKAPEIKAELRGVSRIQAGLAKAKK